ncbi:MAG: class I SAM-dependent methyltransferase [Candidatus Eremiobacteraeota bacterium]|nr:class I SAM-dependent methyltransferase [Candidatus Eremiobacteraeota bacterium]
MPKVTDLLLTSIENTLYQAVIQLRDFAGYGIFPWYWKLKFIMAGFEPPYQIIERRALHLPVSPDELVYGETPLFTLDRIFKKIGLNKKDHFLDLGCGRGIPVIFANLRYRCKATGIEIVPELLEQARTLARIMHINDVHFRPGDIKKESLDEGSVYMICGTTFHSTTLEIVGKKLTKISEPVRVISLSSPLPGLQVIDKERLPFSWGKATVYYQDNV